MSFSHTLHQDTASFVSPASLNDMSDAAYIAERKAAELKRKLETINERMSDIEHSISPLLASGMIGLDEFSKAWNRFNWRRPYDWGGRLNDSWKESWVKFHISAQCVFDEWIGDALLHRGQQFEHVDLYRLLESLEELPLIVFGDYWEGVLSKDFVIELRERRLRRESTKSFSSPEQYERYRERQQLIRLNTEILEERRKRDKSRNELKRTSKARGLRKKGLSCRTATTLLLHSGTVSVLGMISDISEEQETIPAEGSSLTIAITQQGPDNIAAAFKHDNLSHKADDALRNSSILSQTGTALNGSVETVPNRNMSSTETTQSSICSDSAPASMVYGLPTQSIEDPGRSPSMFGGLVGGFRHLQVYPRKSGLTSDMPFLQFGRRKG